MCIADTTSITATPYIAYPVEIDGNDIITANAERIQRFIPEMIDKFFLTGIKRINSCVTCSDPEQSGRRFRNISYFGYRFVIQMVINEYTYRFSGSVRSVPVRSTTRRQNHIVHKHEKSKGQAVPIFYRRRNKIAC